MMIPIGTIMLWDTRYAPLPGWRYYSDADDHSELRYVIKTEDKSIVRASDAGLLRAIANLNRKR